MYELKNLHWIAIDLDTGEIWWSPFEEGKCFWNTRISLLEDLYKYYNDKRKKNRYSVVGSGWCVYSVNKPKKKSYDIIQIYPENIEEYTKLLNEQNPTTEGGRYHY